VDDLDTAVQRAQAAGATLETKTEAQEWGRLALMADPFGHGLCLLQFIGRGYDEIAESPESGNSVLARIRQKQGAAEAAPRSAEN
jgi:hypothetical protein